MQKAKKEREMVQNIASSSSAKPTTCDEVCQIKSSLHGHCSCHSRRVVIALRVIDKHEMKIATYW